MAGEAASQMPAQHHCPPRRRHICGFQGGRPSASASAAPMAQQRRPLPSVLARLPPLLLPHSTVPMHPEDRDGATAAQSGLAVPQSHVDPARSPAKAPPIERKKIFPSTTPDQDPIRDRQNRKLPSSAPVSPASDSLPRSLEKAWRDSSCGSWCFAWLYRTYAKPFPVQFPSPTSLFSNPPRICSCACAADPNPLASTSLFARRLTLIASARLMDACPNKEEDHAVLHKGCSSAWAGMQERN